MEIALIQKYIPHYRLQFFLKLLEKSKYNWEFIYGNHPGKGWSGLEVNPEELLPSRKVETFYFANHFAWQKNVGEIIKTGKYSAIVFELGLYLISNISLVLQAHRLSIPLVGWGKGIPERSRNRNMVLRSCERWLYKHCAAIIAYGKVSAEHFAALGIPREKIFIAQNTVDTQEIFQNLPDYKREAKLLRSELGLNNKPVIGYLGRLVPEKEVDKIIKAFILASTQGVDALLRYHTLLPPGTIPYVMDPAKSINIDSWQDWMFLQCMVKHRQISIAATVRGAA